MHKIKQITNIAISKAKKKLNKLLAIIMRLSTHTYARIFRTQRSRRLSLMGVGVLVIGALVFAFYVKNAEAAWYDTAWLYRKQLTFNNSAQDENLDDFPALVVLDSTNFDFTQGKTNGEDIRFTDSNGTTLLPYEIESYDSIGQTARIWIKVPRINASSSTDSIYIYWGNSAANDAQDVDNTWNSNYKGVYHLSDDAENTTVTDSSGNGNNLTSSVNTSVHSSTGEIASSFLTMGSPLNLPNQAGSNSELYPSVQLDSSGYPVIAMLDHTDIDLILVHCNDEYCIGDDESVEVVESTASTGYYPSLQLDSSGYPVISYYDASAGDLNFVHCDDVNCAGTETITTLDSVGTVGQWTSMVLDSSDYPVIAYFDNTNDDVKLIHCNDTNCVGGGDTPVVIDATANSDFMHSISVKLDGSGYPVVAYVDYTAKQVEITHCNDAGCIGGDENHNAVVDGGANYQYLSLQLDITNGYPMIAYYNASTVSLYYIHCDDAYCAGTETPVTLDTGYPYYPWMELNSSGNPIIITGRYGVYSYLVTCADTECSSKSIDYLALYNQYGGNYPSMVLDSNDYPVIVDYGSGKIGYYDSHLYRLKPKIKQNYDSDFDFGTGSFSASLWFKGSDIQQNYLLSRYDKDQGFKIWLNYAGKPCFGIDDDASFGPDDLACQTSANINQNVDSNFASNVVENSMTLDGSGYPVIAYFEDGTDDLEIVHCNDANCAGSNETTASIDTTGDVGRTPSIVLDSSGYPVIAYHDNTNQDLKIVHCGDVNCSSGNTINTVDSGGDVGDYPSLQLDSSGYPVIGYQDLTNTAVKLAHCNDANCSGGNESIVTVDNTEDDRLYYASEWMKLDTSGYPVMAYTNVSSWDLKVAHCNDVYCAGGDESITTPASVGAVGLFTSMELDASGYPVVAFNRDWLYLQLMHCNDAYCAGSDETINTVSDVDTYGSSGYYYNDLELNSSNGYPVISHTALGHWQQMITACNDVDCAGNDEVHNEIREDVHNYIRSSLVLDSNNYPVISTSRASWDLSLLHFDNATTYTDTNRYDDGAWHHLVAVKSGTSSIRMYIDGVEIASDTSLAANGTLTSNSAEMRLAETITQIGGNNYSTYQWGGNIDEVQIDNTARSADWIAAQYLNESNNFINTGVTQPGPSAINLGTFTDNDGALRNNLVGYWKFDEGYSTVANNSGNGGSSQEGTITGATWSNDGKFGKALNFNGTSSDYVGVTYTGLTGLSGLTVSAWVKSTNISEAQNVIQQNGPYFLQIVGSKVIGRIYTNSTYVSTPGGQTLENDTWYHLTLIYDGAAAKVYVNGKLDNQIEKTGTLGASNKLYIGYPNTVGGYQYPFYGLIDEVKLYNAALTEDEIKQDMNQRSATVLGALSDTSNLSGGSIASSSATASYCVPGSSDPCSAPIGEWNFEEKTDQYVYDISGNGKSGTLGANSSPSTDDPSWATGKIGGALDFDGSNDYVPIGTASDFEITDEMTIEFWMYPRAHTANWVRPISKGGYMDNGWSIYTGAVGSNILYPYFGINSGGGWSGAFAPAISYQLNQWQHVAVTVKLGSIGKSYLNGVDLGNVVPATYYPTTVKSLRVGSENGGWFNGKIDQVRIYDYVRTPAQIAYDYNRGKPIGHWKLDECSGIVANDSSGNGNSGDITIGVTVPQTSAGSCTVVDTATAWYNGAVGKFNSGLNFDGVDDFVDMGNVHNYDDLTVSAWVNLDTDGVAPDSIVQKENQYFLRTDTSGKMRFYIYKGSTWDYVESTSNWNQQVFINWTGTYDSTTGIMKIYKNGVLENTDVHSTGSGTIVATTNALRIGKRLSSEYAKGIIDDVRIYNYVLTPAQIKGIFNEGSSVRFGP